MTIIFKRFLTFSLATLLLVIALLALWQHSARDRPRQQTPKAPYPYAIRDISITASDGARLGATLVTPRNKGPHAAVVLLGVAGPNDRDLTFRGHKGFAVLADALARCNIASVRFDDRGVGVSGGDWLEASYAQLEADAILTAKLLMSELQIDARRVGLVGLSEGAAIALLASASDPSIGFAALLSPPALRGEDGLREQFDRMISWSPWISHDAALNYRRSFDRFVLLSRRATTPTGKKELSHFLQNEGRGLVPSYGFVPATVDGRVRLFSSSWYRSQLDYDPSAALQAIKSPVLIISGELDQVLPPSVHLPRLHTALNGKDATFQMIDGANHLLMPGWTGLPLEYPHLEQTLDPRVAPSLCEWIRARLA